MKTTVLALAAIVSTTLLADIKIATVNMVDLIRFHPEREKDMQVLRESEAGHKRALEAARDKLEDLAKEAQELQQKLQNPLVQEKVKEDAAKKLDSLREKAIEAQQSYQMEARRAQAELQRLDETMLRATTDSIRKRVEAYAQEKGYDIIVDTSVTPFSKKSLDVTDEILKLMGVDPEKARAEAKAKEDAAALKQISTEASLPLDKERK